VEISEVNFWDLLKNQNKTKQKKLIAEIVPKEQLAL